MDNGYGASIGFWGTPKIKVDKINKNTTQRTQRVLADICKP